ncbi:MAG: exo-alpha-sialidase [Chthoniobacter sp.]|uniref:exo-alpha-sialidase n=1 Tax=Chthoniobacter sp. TaxID=2510640 RepID=UPI0032A67A3B
MKHFLAVGVFLLALLAGSVAWAGPVTIVAFGDSTTAARGKTVMYATLLANELAFDGAEVRVLNAGVGGNTTAMAKARFEKDVLAQKPDVVILQFGINDAAVDVWKNPAATTPRVALTEYRANLSGMIRTLEERGTRVVLMTSNSLSWTPTLRKLYAQAPYLPDDADGMNVVLREYAETVRGLAREEGVGLVDIYAAFQQADRDPAHKPGWLCGDGMHPDDAGQRLVAEQLIIHLTAVDARFARRPHTVWTRSGAVDEINPLATDITHDTPAPAVLGPALVKLADGAVMSVYSTPTSYAGKPGQCYLAGRITRDGGKTWEAERELTRLPEGRAAHPTVRRTRDGTIHLFFLGYRNFAWDRQTGNPTEATRSDLWTVRSRDEGQTWSAPQRIFEGYTGSTNGAEESQDGHLVVPFSHYVAQPGRLASRAVVSQDGGQTWKLSNTLDIGGAGDHEGALEPCVLELKDHRLWMLIRTSRKFFWESFSTDGGLTWSEAKPTTIDSSHSPGHVIRLADGRLALAWNPSTNQRRELHLALSEDEGRTWSPSLVAARGNATYPFVLEASPGELWVGYMDCHDGWGTTPRARHLKIAEQAILDLAKAK